jgi:hypothetical protein
MLSHSPPDPYNSLIDSGAKIFLPIYRFRPKAGEAELLVVGRVFVLVLVGVAIIWIPIIQVTLTII